MADLAIKGHPTRGKEVIQLLEMLGGVNKHQIGAIRQTYVYFIDTDGIIRLLQIDQLLPEKDIVYSLEEFEEKYPFKVGDKVTLDNKLCSIIWMCWECNNIYYQVQGIGDVFTKKVTADELKLYKERNNMGKKLAIKGHPTRGEEVIEILKMLGGTNDYFKHDGKIESFYYYIGDFNNHIYQCGLPSEMKCFTLEEFEEKYPYKVGDKVISLYGKLGRIRSLIWSERDNQVRYELEADVDSLYFANELQPVEEKETMEEKGTLVQIDFTRELRIADEVEVILGDYEFVLKDGKTYFVKKKPQYPKTYEECCRIVNANPCVRLIYDLSNGQKYSYDVDNLQHYENIRKLLICRDAYWKIAGEQMGLGKPWKPDFTNNDEERYGIYTLANKVERDFCGVGDVNMILSFPTAKMRNAFYENFKDLIERCKELL